MLTEIDGIKINYIDEGTGPDVLIIHGWGSSCHVFDGIINRFKDRFRFVAPDLPGCGESGVMGNPWTVADYADFIKKFIAAAKLENPIFMGHSHGGRVTLYMAGNGLISPEKIVLFGSAGIVNKKPLSVRLKIKAYKTAKKVLSSPLLRKPCAGILKDMEAKAGSADYRAAPPVLRRTLTNVVNTDVRDTLGNIKASTLLIWGEGDTATPIADGRLMEKLIPDCGLCPLKGAGHYCFLERPFDTFAILDSFLGGKERQ